VHNSLLIKRIKAWNIQQWRRQWVHPKNDLVAFCRNQTTLAIYIQGSECTLNVFAIGALSHNKPCCVAALFQTPYSWWGEDLLSPTPPYLSIFGFKFWPFRFQDKISGDATDVQQIMQDNIYTRAGASIP